MNYNQLSYYRANPFYKQGYQPDSSQNNTTLKQYPSQIPSGKDYFPKESRKHFQHRFNHSQIEQDNILKSIQKYPFEHRIALDKSYRRNLDTIDIEGASSNTRINPSIKYKLRARDEISEKINQPRQPIDTTEQTKRKQIAHKQYDLYQQRSYSQPEHPIVNEDRLDAKEQINPEKGNRPSKVELSNEYKHYVMHNSNNKYEKKIIKPQYTPNQISQSKFRILQSDQTHLKKRQNSMTIQYTPNMFKNSQPPKQLINPRYLRKANPTNLSSSFAIAGQFMVSS